MDKLGRKVNKYDFLFDKDGNLVDKKGRVKLTKDIMEKTKGDIPLLFNYKGKKFNLQDVMGDDDEIMKEFGQLS